MGKLLYKAFGEIQKHFLTDHFGRSETYFWGKKLQMIHLSVWKVTN